ncbi:hypothetical protein COW36_05540 [bacterium (Candidatus Blackallbacteria) CG17_big_fil_post_rev_8_21_14_2_50_48_46]|uniref:Uncharacterized protein n=1 Tax=bacterium (Candidatus Blackallbacteria) CG17_big_fil_post_rev_8_21_14_2_50_48_46 TaxID=2014261 RepID=A0A2M7G8R3_9BACT|nr:MAG: hypothetical protein COW64_21135 [bacterium (Candidatus Blackallbacteria) CG18_big_fil_WC_8_21_14_2_50_49_26]PIW18231.1 MAG: hypothetical protein COW36_05540 [bacterium (Candidatus Blackallbacteria) CG17_big_fil_post_rev_8_21_14_2_50_48_46]PIW50662.1 MAG: hypothetical protein COW20_01805 [bacterium (Candidatus Blackallbacteria) CG13_big_fil_rev_8_21_14_2_50_49_14]
MRQIAYPAWLKPFLILNFVLGAGLSFLPLLRPLGWGLMLQAGYLAIGYVCIYVAELESDFMTQAKREVGDWNGLIVALTRLRTENCEAAVLAEALQVLNRQFWREYLLSRRYLLRSSLKPNSELEQRFKICNQVAIEWKNLLEAKLASRDYQLQGEEKQALLTLQELRQA